MDAIASQNTLIALDELLSATRQGESVHLLFRGGQEQMVQDAELFQAIRGRFYSPLDTNAAESTTAKTAGAGKIAHTSPE